MRTPALALILTVCASSASADIVTVYMFDFDFSTNLPGQPVVDPTINVGDTVLWVPLADFHNTVACVGQAEFWNSPILQTFDTFSYTFDVPGVYNYYCAPHGFDNGDGTATGMTGTITVVPSPGVLGVGLAAAACLARRRVR